MRKERNHRSEKKTRARVGKHAAERVAREELPTGGRPFNSRPNIIGGAQKPSEGRREATQADAAFPRPAETAETRPHAERIYGVLPVLEALRARSRPIERITMAEGVHESRLGELLRLARDTDVPIRRVPRADLQRLAAPGANHQGVVAVVAAAHYHGADELLDQLAARAETDDAPLAVVLDGVEDPRNLGAIIRTAECAGVHAVFVPERRAVGLTETVAKASAGALEYVPVARTANVARLIEELKGRGLWVIGAAAEAGEDYTSWDWTVPCALVLGGEAEGLRRLVRERCDALVRVPLRGRISSLNVSVAAGVLLYEAVRQRTAKDAAT